MIRATPTGTVRDVYLFPEMALSRARSTIYRVSRYGTKKRFAYILVDDFALPPSLQARLNAIHKQYADWWVSEARARRESFPREGIICAAGESQSFQGLFVLAKHLPWWLDLLNWLARYGHRPGHAFDLGSEWPQ